MIINISDTEAIWFGYRANNGNNISFLEGIYRLLHEAGGYDIEEVKGRFGKGDKEVYPVGKAMFVEKGKTESHFLNNARTFMRSFTGHDRYAYPNHAIIIKSQPRFKLNPGVMARDIYNNFVV